MPMCKHCESREHSSFYCFQKPRKPIRRVKRIRRHGKYYKKWQETRTEWLKQNNAPFYYCYLCGIRVKRSELTLDHIKPRSRHPELRYELANLAPCCWWCNTKKGSKVYETNERSSISTGNTGDLQDLQDTEDVLQA